jgi:FtsP/CotA-like multicopper oxidase with cupredoxin domain
MPGGWHVMNGKSFPDTQPVLISQAQTVHVRFIGADTMMVHPLHLLSHTFNLVAHDGHMPPRPVQLDIISRLLSHLMNPVQTAEEIGELITLVEYAKLELVEQPSSMRDERRDGLQSA